MDDLLSQQGGLGAVYNMAPVGTAPEQGEEGERLPDGWIAPEILPTMSCDKLRLGCYCRGQPDPESLFPPTEKLLGGGVGFGWRAGRNQGSLRSRTRGMLLFGRPGDDGVCYLQVEEIQDSALPLKVVLEFNPNKLLDDHLRFLAEWFLSRMGVSSWAEWFVERHDIAFDYAGADRARFMLDDPGRKLDMFGVGRCGPETERTGYRKGSHLRAQIYDKREEQGGGGGSRVRFEVSVSALVPRRYGKGRVLGEAPTMLELPTLPWPAEGIGVRFLACGGVPTHPTLEWALTLLTRAYGSKLGGWFAKSLLGARRREAWRECMVPELRPLPADVYRQGWAAVVRGLLQRLTPAPAAVRA